MIFVRTNRRTEISQLEGFQLHLLTQSQNFPYRILFPISIKIYNLVYFRSINFIAINPAPDMGDLSHLLIQFSRRIILNETSRPVNCTNIPTALLFFLNISHDRVLEMNNSCTCYVVKVRCFFSLILSCEKHFLPRDSDQNNSIRQRLGT